MRAPSHDHGRRLRLAAEHAAGVGIDALVVTPSADLVYLAGYDPPLLPRLTALVLRPDADPVLVVPMLERARAERAPVAALAELRGWMDGEDPYAVVASIVGSGRVAVSDRMWAAHLLGLQRSCSDAVFQEASPLLARLRSRKDETEVELLARAASAADAAFEDVVSAGLAGRTEVEVAAALAEALVRHGHGSVSFTIVGSGPNGASPHHEPEVRVIQEGEAVVLDFGGRVDGYGSDITRTVAVGEPTEEVRRVHSVVREAQQAAFEAVRPGVAAQHVDRVARRVIADAGFGEWFVHRTGHGIGLEEHEHPYIVEGNAETLEEGMCFSIEPGIYLPGRFGVRIEDIVTVEAGGARRLNEAPRELLTVA